QQGLAGSVRRGGVVAGAVARASAVLRPAATPPARGRAMRVRCEMPRWLFSLPPCGGGSGRGVATAEAVLGDLQPRPRERALLASDPARGRGARCRWVCRERTHG